MVTYSFTNIEHLYIQERNGIWLTTVSIFQWICRAIIQPSTLKTWWHHQMETFSALLALCAGNSPATGEFPAQRPVTRSYDVFFDLRPNKRLSKQPWGWWFETPSWSLWRQCDEVRTVNYCPASSHHDHGANLFCPGVVFCSSKQSLKLYESPIDNHHKYEQNLKRIMRQSLVGHSIDRRSDPF